MVALLGVLAVGAAASCSTGAAATPAVSASPASSVAAGLETQATDPTDTPATTPVPPPTTSPATTSPATTSPPTTSPATTLAPRGAPGNPPGGTTGDTTDQGGGSSATAGAAAGTSGTDGELSFANLEQAVFFLALDNLAVSISVRRDGDAVWNRAVGRRVDRAPVTSDTPFVVASVSKLVTALSVARLVEQGRLTTDTRVPWSEMGLAHDPSWESVTVRELLSHTSGMPINRRGWLDDPGPCSIPLTEALAAPPTMARTTWQYSNGNYCALGLLVEHLTGTSLDAAANDLVFEPAGISGPYLSTDGLRPDSAPSARGVARLARLGGAGSWLASTDDVATMLSEVTDDDLEVLQWPGILVDQYGWGHTGTVDGAKACAWVLEDGRTTVAAVVSGRAPATGGDVCDLVVPALALDLGIWQGEPKRSPV